MRRLLCGLVPLVTLATLALAVFACGSEAGEADGGAVVESPDAQTDAPGTVDVGSGGPDATSDSSPPGPFCSSLAKAPKLCEDFDDGQVPPSADTQIDPGSSCAIDTTTSLSPSSSYHCSIPPLTTTVQNALLRMLVPFDASATRFVASFAFRPDLAPPGTGNAVIARAFVGSAHAIAVELTSPNGPVLREQENAPGGLEKTAPITALPPVTAWTRYELAVDLGTKTATLKADGATVATLALAGTQYNLFALNLGVQADMAFGGRFDDVTLDY